MPTFTEERLLETQGFRYIAGIDEVGRGALAGPVVAAAVVLPSEMNTPWLGQVRDSKQLSPARRELLFHHIHEAAVAIGIGQVDGEVVDRQGIIRATQLAMELAVARLSPSPEALLIDYMLLPGINLPQKGLTKGDCRCFSIACASIIAKVARDRIMRELDGAYPGYEMARHKGYGTRVHLEYLQKLGLSPVHRRSFRPVRELS